MTHTRRCLGGLLLALSLALGACALTPSLGTDDLAAVRSGQRSAVVLAYRPLMSMSIGRFRLENVSTGQVYDLTTRSNSAILAVAVAAVPPGRYRMGDSSVMDMRTSAELPRFRAWFDEFEVAPGEIVNLGALTANEIDVHANAGLAANVISLVRDWSLAGGATYLTYTIDDFGQDRVEKALAPTYAELGASPVWRPLHARLDKARFERAVLDAYAPGPDGREPTVAEAETRANAAIARLILDAASERQAATPPPLQ